MSDRIFAAAVLLLAIAYGATGWGYRPPFAYEPIGPWAFPVLLSLLLAGCALRLLARPDAEPDWPGGRLAGKSLAMLATLTLYGLFFVELGFVVATGLMGFAVGLLFGGGWRRSAAGGIGLALALFVLFDRLLEVSLPLGRLFGA